MTRLRRAARTVMIGLILAGVGTQVSAEDVSGATREECIAFVKRAVDYYKANGSEKAVNTFNSPGGSFHDRDLYIVVYDQKGTLLANGQYPRLVGKNRLNEQDSDGVHYVRERLKLAEEQSSFWGKFRFPDPLTHKMMPKQSYCEVVQDGSGRLLICAGIYDRTAEQEGTTP